MNNSNQPIKINHTTIEIESLAKPINRKKIIRYSREFICDPKHILLFKREFHPAISQHELISCHFIEDENLDRHLDRLNIGFREAIEGHSKWIFPRNIRSRNNQQIGLPEQYFTENFCHFFKYVIDVDTEAVFKIEEFSTQRREDLMYKPPLYTEQLVYVSDVIELVKPYSNALEKQIVQLINDSGYIDDYVNLVNSVDETEIYSGIYTTKKPHLALIISEPQQDKTVAHQKFILVDTQSLKIVGVYSNSYQPDRRNFFLITEAENEDFRKLNDIIAE
ncbi:hypothetical protein AO073_01595 [Pseudomonas syringae ICMP 11293]|uniref:hypothetical protein n=1 Tax=Pseudomonas syringae TaxID=317 RepID=UPI000730F202|nr:hypothetical protein [Pseudomonas syringae]KTB91594.1 hypothetical protein AO073_01595 [Pseudomonas syringae ICMP 11293]